MQGMMRFLSFPTSFPSRQSSLPLTKKQRRRIQRHFSTFIFSWSMAFLTNLFLIAIQRSALGTGVLLWFFSTCTAYFQPPIIFKPKANMKIWSTRFQLCSTCRYSLCIPIGTIFCRSLSLNTTPISKVVRTLPIQNHPWRHYSYAGHPNSFARYANI